MAAWQILGYIIISISGVVAILGLIEMIKTLPQMWNTIPVYEEDSEEEAWND